jgi:hypothetical protein
MKRFHVLRHEKLVLARTERYIDLTQSVLSVQLIDNKNNQITAREYLHWLDMNSYADSPLSWNQCSTPYA